MSMQYPVADMLTRIRNGQMARLTQVIMPSSKLKIAICRVLQEEGYIEGYEMLEDKAKPELIIKLKYHHGLPAISRLEITSKPGLRQYRKRNNLPLVLGGLGVAIVSTSQGVMTAKQARTVGQGGELLCVIE